MCVCVCERDIGREIINIPKRFFSYSDRCDAIVKKKKMLVLVSPSFSKTKVYRLYNHEHTHTRRYYYKCCTI